MGSRANPAFAAGAVAVPVLALAYVVTMGTVRQHTYVHVMAGVLWTGIDLFMAAVLGPVLGGLDVEARADVFQRFTPKMTFLMPMLALVTIVGGITLALRLGRFPNADPWLAIMNAAIVVPALLLIGYQFRAFDDRRWQAVFAVATVASVAYLAVTLPGFAMTSPVVAVSLGLVVVLSVLGFGVLLPGEVLMYTEMTSADPNTRRIADIGMRNAKLAGVQGLFQLTIVFVMVSLRWGGF
ncbi:hypothetical protein BRC89_07520 [Halobacteriales archaeon QS_4_70_19]|nr:MAG: hypothetical protein BRC89_07520 [Halobacteriales archaeon QS_4_70_19]